MAGYDQKSYARAVVAGATSLEAPSDQEYVERIALRLAVRRTESCAVRRLENCESKFFGNRDVEFSIWLVGRADLAKHG